MLIELNINWNTRTDVGHSIEVLNTTDSYASLTINFECVYAVQLNEWENVFISDNKISTDGETKKKKKHSCMHS